MEKSAREERWQGLSAFWVGVFSADCQGPDHLHCSELPPAHFLMLPTWPTEETESSSTSVETRSIQPAEKGKDN
jgi:hypothetical protein